MYAKGELRAREREAIGRTILLEGLPTATVYCALKPASDERWDTVIQPDLSHVFPTHAMQILPATAPVADNQHPHGVRREVHQPHGDVRLAVYVQIRGLSERAIVRVQVQHGTSFHQEIYPNGPGATEMKRMSVNFTATSESRKLTLVCAYCTLRVLGSRDPHNNGSGSNTSCHR